MKRRFRANANAASIAWAILWDIPGMMTGSTFFRCVDCGAQGPHAPSIELAAMGWDTRFRGTTEILQTASKVIKQCESCGSMFSDLGYHWLPRIAYCPICGAKVAYMPLPDGVEAE